VRATPSTPSDLASPGPSSAIVSFQQFNLGLPPEDAIEMYYNMAITLWMNLTSDLHIVGSALNKDQPNDWETHRHRHPRHGRSPASHSVLVGGQHIRPAAGAIDGL